MSRLPLEDREAGHWKRECIAKRMASLRAALAQVLKPVNLYTGLPAKTQEALRYGGVCDRGRRARAGAVGLQRRRRCERRRLCARGRRALSWWGGLSFAICVSGHP